MSSLSRPLFYTFKNIGRSWLKRTRPDYVRQRPHFEFTVASYNVLADQLLQEHSFLYYGQNGCHEPWVYDWNYRKRNLIAEITHANADILCLQEVQEEHYYNWFHPQLQKHGYTGLYKKRSGNKPDGCATFFKNNLFTIHSYELVDFYRPNIPLMDRNNVGIILILNPVSREMRNPSPICIGNTHLLFNKKRGDIKLTQLAHLFAEIDKCTKDYHDPIPIILCGDFNSTPFSPLCDFVNKGMLKFEGLNLTNISGQSDFGLNHRHRHKFFGPQLFPPNLGLTHTCKWNTKLLTDQQTKFIDLTQEQPSNEEIPGYLSHNLQLRSCYMHRGLDGKPEVTTCHDKASLTVDYIFYSPNTFKTSTSHTDSQNEDRLWLAGVLSLLSEQELCQMGKLPNPQVSSDHLMLLANFVLT